MEKILAHKFALIFAALFLFTNPTHAATGEWHENESKGARTRLVASFYQNQNGETKLIAGVEFKIAKGWKIYGNGSEGIGLPPSFDFSTSPNYTSHKIIWPQAQQHEEKIGSEIFKYSAYHEDVILPIEINLEKNKTSADLTAKLNYGLCKDVCIPVSETFNLKIDTTPDLEVLGLIQNFYPEKIIEKNDIIETNSNATTAKSAPSLAYWIALAIIGGAILNIMPCVLPVLSIKLLSIINHSNAAILRIRFAFISTILGIVLCFFVFAIFAALIKIAGNSFGWGLQFQNPYFLICLIIILILFTINLLGIFEITFDQFLANFLHKKITDSEGKKNIFLPNFLSGILAVLLATPCSAPILGSAISFALTQQISTIFVIFCAIGIGFATPYLVLSITPRLIFLLPKSGSWMLKTKKLMALLLFITAAWLIYILSHNIGIMPALAITIILLLAVLCFEIKSKILRISSFIILVTLAFSIPKISMNQNLKTEEQLNSNLWIEFDEREIYQAVMKGKIVVIDVTADWCITCKINKITVLNNAEIIEELSKENVVTMRADITKPNEEVMNFLRKHNRYAIPFNAVYGPNAKGGILTSELLTKKELLQLIKQAK